ncbi:hypothetical protein ACSXDQ_00530 [Clostridium perfringens]
MISLKKPEDSVKDVFTKCIGNIRDEKLKEKLNFCLPSIVNITDEYEDKAKEGLLYQIEEHDNICGLVTTNEMKKYIQISSLKTVNQEESIMIYI